MWGTWVMSPDLSRHLDMSAHKLFPVPPTSSLSDTVESDNSYDASKTQGLGCACCWWKALAWLPVRLAQHLSDSVKCCQVSCEGG